MSTVSIAPCSWAIFCSSVMASTSFSARSRGDSDASCQACVVTAGPPPVCDQGSEDRLDGDAAGRPGLSQRLVVALVLVGVRLREPGHGTVEAVAWAEIAADRDRVAGARV